MAKFGNLYIFHFHFRNHHPIDILPFQCRLEEEVGLVVGLVCICILCTLKVEGFFQNTQMTNLK